MKNVAIIGANWGDEGKGRTVDRFAQSSKEKTLNIRFSGSNNAGHTVWKDGQSVVFNLLGAASFHGIPTYLSQHVCVDLAALASEIKRFESMTGINPIDYIDPRCRLILPYDVLKNRIKEIVKGENKHGSTGNGLNEAIDRHLHNPIIIGSELISSAIGNAYESFIEFVDASDFTGVDFGAHQKHIDEFMSARSVSKVYHKIQEIIDTTENIIVTTPNLQEYNCIFEGSQGLALDEYSKYFPYVTRSRTGLTNVIDLCREHNITIDDVYYISRVYQSRHGEDKFFKESQTFGQFFEVEDLTNVNNDWQDSLKFAFLNIVEMEARIEKDFSLFVDLYPETKQHRVFTCVDQATHETFPLITEDGPNFFSADSLELSYDLAGIGTLFFSNKENNM